MSLPFSRIASGLPQRPPEITVFDVWREPTGEVARLRNTTSADVIVRIINMTEAGATYSDMCHATGGTDIATIKRIQKVYCAHLVRKSQSDLSAEEAVAEARSNGAKARWERMREESDD